jgi:hypothetical protein
VSGSARNAAGKRPKAAGNPSITSDTRQGDMSIWNKILLGLIFVAAMGFWYLGMRTLKTHKYWREIAIKLDRQIVATENENRQFAQGEGDGAEAKLGIRQYQQRIHQLVVDRGRVWTNCDPQNFNAQTGQGKIVTDQPNPNGLAPKAILYAFEEKEADAAGNGGRFLGEFEVEAVNENQVQVKPTMKLGPRQLQRIAQASKPWIVYEKMPVDNHEALADLSEGEKKKMLPAESAPSYLRDGEAATWEQMEQWGVRGTLVDDSGKAQVDADGKPTPNAKGKYVRQLHDYNTIFRLRSDERVLLTDRFEALKRDIQYMQASVAEAKQQVEARKRQIDAAKTELAKVHQERGAVVAHFSTLKAQIKLIEDAVRQLLASNKQFTEAIKHSQEYAAQQIDARTRAMAQVKEGGE